MSIEWLLYFIDLINNLNGFFGLLIFFTVMVMVILFAKMCADNFPWMDEDDKCNYWMEIKGKLKTCTVVILLSSLVLIIIPSQKTMYAIALAHYSKQSDIPAKVLKAIEVKLDDIITQKEKL